MRQPGELDYAEALAAAREQRERRSSGWACTSPATATMSDIAETFGLHELAVEDAVKAEQRPKLEQYGEIDLPACCAPPATSSTAS